MFETWHKYGSEKAKAWNFNKKTQLSQIFPIKSGKAYEVDEIDW